MTDPSGPPPLHRCVPAVPGALVGLRTELGAWFGGLADPPRRPDDLVLAVHEALANAVEHGYRDRPPGEVELRVEHDGPELRVVDDSGSWREPDPDPGARGHGLRLMAAIADAVDIDRRPGGTTVTLTWRAGPVSRRAAPG